MCTADCVDLADLLRDKGKEKGIERAATKRATYSTFGKDSIALRRSGTIVVT